MGQEVAHPPITEMWAFFYADNGGETLVCEIAEGSVIPYLAADEVRMHALWSRAEAIAREQGTPIIVRHFSADSADIAIIAV